MDLVKLVQGMKSYTVSRNKVREQSATLDSYFRNMGSNEIGIPNSVLGINFFLSWLEGKILNIAKYEQIQLALYLKSDNYLEDIFEHFKIRSNPNYEEIDNLPESLKYQIYLRIPYEYVHDDYTDLKTDVGKKFIKEWIEINQGNGYNYDVAYHNNGNISRLIRYLPLDPNVNMFPLMDGIKYFWYNDGSRLLEEYYVNGRQEGEQHMLFSNGRMKTKSNYLNGKMEGKYYEWDSEGNIQTIYNYVKGKREGIQQTFYESGNEKTREYYVNEYKEGEQYEWHPNGMLFKQQNYVDGDRKGKQYRWDIDGNLEKEEDL